MNAVTVVNIVLGALLALCYLYQFVYIFISYFSRRQCLLADRQANIAVLVCARNESLVIERLLDSLNAQDYPRDKYRVFVVADNCTDDTYGKAVASGAQAYQRFNETEVGKGYALDFLIKKIKNEYGNVFDAFLVFDADNLISENYLTEINKTLNQGYDVVTSYRASLNYGDNWISAGHGMCFLRDMVLLNRARHVIGTTSFVSGTGYLFTSSLCDSFGGGWPFHTLTEDCEFTMYNAVSGTKMGYCDSAVFYDEQPTSIKTSYNQRLRWCRGGIQVFVKYIGRIVRSAFSCNLLSSFDMAMCMAPAYILSVIATLVNTVGTAISLALGEEPFMVFVSLAIAVAGVYLALLSFSVPLTISEWSRIRASAFKKLLYNFTFPIFMFTFLPIACMALIKRRVVWQETKRKLYKK